MGEPIDLQVMLDAMTAEMIAQRQIIFYLAGCIEALGGTTVPETADRLKSLEYPETWAPVRERLHAIADIMAGTGKPSFSIIQGGIVDD